MAARVDGGKLREARERALLSRRELAEKSGVSMDTIQRVELGESGAYGSTIRKLAGALKLDPAEILEEPVGAGKAEAPEAGPNDGERRGAEVAAAIEAARVAAREETLRMVEEQDALLGKHMALLLDQQLEWQLDRLNSRLDRAESAAARNDAARDMGNWFFSSTLWIEQVRRHYPEIWVPELVRSREAARVAVEEFAPNFTSPERHEEVTRRLAGIEAATAAQDAPPTGPSRRVRLSGGPTWGVPADPTEAEAPSKGA